MKHKLFLLLLLFVVISSCKNELVQGNMSHSRKASGTNPEMYRSMNFGMPFTEPYELEMLSDMDSENIIDYRVARYLATVELLAGANFALSDSPEGRWCLTPYPKVVYNYDNSPKYYEFGYVRPYDGVVATVVTYAQKEVDGVIAYLFANALSQEFGEYDYYVGRQYPERYYGNEMPEFYYDTEACGLEPIDFELHEIGTDEYMRQLMYREMESEDIAEMENDLLEEDDFAQEEYQQDYYDYWNDVNNFFDNYGDALSIPNMENIEFRSIMDYITGNYNFNPEKESYYVALLMETLDYMVGYFDSYVLPEYSNYRLQITRWTGYCGPSACAWVYRGKYDSYDGKYLPIFENNTKEYFEYGITGTYAYYNIGSVDVYGLDRDEARDMYIRRSYEADYGLSACFYEESVPLWWDGEWTFPLYHGGLNRGFDKATGGEYKVKFTCKPYGWIHDKKQPVIIAVDCSHYIVAFGTGTTYKKNGKIKDKYFSIVDNGYFTGDFGYQPYMRRHNGWNLHYGLTLKN